MTHNHHGLSFAVLASTCALLAMPAAVVVPERPGELLREPVVQAVDQIAHVIDDVAEVQILPLPVAGIDDLLEIVGDLDDGVGAGERAMGGEWTWGLPRRTST